MGVRQIAGKGGVYAAGNIGGIPEKVSQCEAKTVAGVIQDVVGKLKGRKLHIRIPGFQAGADADAEAFGFMSIGKRDGL